MRRSDVHVRRTGPAGRLRSTQDRRAGGDHVVIEDDLTALDLTNERLTGDDPQGPSFLHEGEIDIASKVAGEDLPHPLGALHSATVRTPRR